MILNQEDPISVASSLALAHQSHRATFRDQINKAVACVAVPWVLNRDNFETMYVFAVRHSVRNTHLKDKARGVYNVLKFNQ